MATSKNTAGSFSLREIIGGKWRDTIAYGVTYEPDELVFIRYLSDIPRFSIVLIPEYGTSPAVPSWSNVDTAFLSQCVESPRILECVYGTTKDEEFSWLNLIPMGDALLEQLLSKSADNQVSKPSCFNRIDISDISC